MNIPCLLLDCNVHDMWLALFFGRCVLLKRKSKYAVCWSKMFHQKLCKNFNVPWASSSRRGLGTCSINWATWTPTTRGRVYVLLTCDLQKLVKSHALRKHMIRCLTKTEVCFGPFLLLIQVSKGMRFLGGETAALSRVYEYFWKKASGNCFLLSLCLVLWCKVLLKINFHLKIY
jgi:hypothetical protein